MSKKKISMKLVHAEFLLQMMDADTNTAHVETHDVKGRDAANEASFKEITEYIKERDDLISAHLYNEITDKDDRISILYALIKECYNIDNVLVFVGLAGLFQNNIPGEHRDTYSTEKKKERTTEKLTVVQLLLAEMKSHGHLDQIEVLFIDCFLSTGIEFNEQTSSSDHNIKKEINKVLEEAVDKVLTTLAEQIINPNPDTDLQLKYRKGRSNESYICSEHFVKVVQRAYKANDDVIMKISEFSVRLSKDLYLVGVARKVLNKLYQLIEETGHVIENNKPELIEAVRQVQIFNLKESDRGDDKIDLKNVGVQLGHNFDEDVLKETVSLIQRGRVHNARTVYRNISEPNYSDLINKTYRKQYIDHLIYFAEANDKIKSLPDLLLKHMIDHGDGQHPAIFQIADMVDKKSETSQKIIKLAIEMVLPIRENNFTMVPFMKNAGVFYIERIVEGVYEPSEDTELKLITFAEKLNTMAENKAGSAKAALQLFIEMDKHNRFTESFLDHMIGDNDMGLPILNSFKMMPQNARKIYIGKIVEGVYKPSEDVELKLVGFAEKLKTIAKNAAGSMKAYSQLYTEMEKHNHIELRPMLALARSSFRENEQMVNLKAKRKDVSDQQWVAKIPWDVKNIVTENPFYLVNNKYQSDHLMVKSSDDTNIVMTSDEAAHYKSDGIKWSLVSNGTHYAVASTNGAFLHGTDTMLYTSGKRKVAIGMQRDYSWEIHDFDWKNNLYMMYNTLYKQYLYSDDQLNQEPPTGRNVYLANVQDPVNPASVWRISQYCET